MHVEQAEAVFGLLGDSVRHRRLQVFPEKGRKCPGPIERLGLVAEIPWRRRPGPAGKFPFRFGRQAIRLLVLLFLLAQPGAERLGIFPGDVAHRLLAALRETGVLPVILRLAHRLLARLDPLPSRLPLPLRNIFLAGDERLELPKRHLRRADIKRLADPDPVLRLLGSDVLRVIVRQAFFLELLEIPILPNLIVGRSHQEFAWRNQRQLHVERVLLEGVALQIRAPTRAAFAGRRRG